MTHQLKRADLTLVFYPTVGEEHVAISTFKDVIDVRDPLLFSHVTAFCIVQLECIMCASFSF